MILSFRRHASPYPPGPPLRSALANMHNFQQRPLDFLARIEQEYGGVACFPIGLLLVYLVTDPAAVRWVLQTNARNYSKETFTYQMARALSGENLLTSDGPAWRRKRRLVQPLFHRNILESFADIMVNAAQAASQRWLEQNKTIDLVEEMMVITLEVAGRALFSTDLAGATPAVRRALNTSAEEVLRQFQSPLALIWTLVGFPPPRSQEMRSANRYLDELLYGLIQERRGQGEMPFDMLSLFLQSVDEETGESMTDREIRDEIGIFLTAGHETTALGLTWAWICLVQNPQIESQLHTEIDRVLGGRLPTVADIPQLSYTQAVFEEALRLYPPVWGFSRRAKEDDSINGYTIPGGARVMISPYVTQRSVRYWEDPSAFCPSRFLVDGRGTMHKPEAYFPFGAGPRQCIGNRFALMEGTLVLATIAQQVQLCRQEEMDVEAIPLATLRPRRSLNLRVACR